MFFRLKTPDTNFVKFKYSKRLIIRDVRNVRNKGKKTLLLGNIMKIKIIALSPTGTGLSGGDRIFIELARNWSKENDVEIITSTEGVKMCKTQKLSGKHLTITSIADKLPGNFWIKYTYKILIGVKYAWHRRLGSKEKMVIYSASEFWMDTFTSVVFKFRNKKTKWF